MDINLNQGTNTSRIQAYGASGRKLPPDFYQKQQTLGKMGGLNPLTMVDTSALENAWKGDNGGNYGDNVIRNARLCP